MVQRFLRDESGITLGLAIMMILLISVMGAGLLTFVSRDLNTVIETNRGQRAFEVADAGIAAAERQLESDCIGDSACMVFYNDDVGDPDPDDLQWSVARGGLTLNDLDGDGNATTSDSVTVTIDYEEVEGGANHFKVISTGTYGGSKRKIEAIFKPIAGGGGGGNVINPAYYTQSDIRIWSDGTGQRGDVGLQGMSLFTKQNIIIESPPETPLSTWVEYRDEMRRGTRDILDVTPGRRVLGDWDTRDAQKFKPPGNWNTAGRRNGNQPFTEPGMAAEGMICNSINNVPDCDIEEPSDSIADGRYGYDSTTGPKDVTGATQTPNFLSTQGQQLTFVDKEELLGPGGSTLVNPLGYISYPFERKAPDAARLKQLALNSGSWYRGSDPPWDSLLGDKKRVAFIDAQNETITLPEGTGNDQGIIIVWCGNLEMHNLGQSGFKGIIMSLNESNRPADSLPPDPETEAASTSCGTEQGTFKSSYSSLQAWTYAEGGSDVGEAIYEPGMDLGPGTDVDFLPSGTWKLLDLILEDAEPTSFELQGWRECYQIEDATQCST